MIQQNYFSKNIDETVMNLQLHQKKFDKSVDCMVYCKAIDRFFVAVDKKILKLKLVNDILEIETELIDVEIKTTAMAVTLDGKFLYQGSVDRVLRVWDLDLDLEEASLKGFKKKILDIILSPDNQYAYICDYDSDIKIYSLSQNKIIKRLEGHHYEDQEEREDNIERLLLSSDGNILYSGGYDDVIRIWNLENYEQTQQLIGHDGTIKSLVLSKDQKILYSGASDDQIKIWDLKTFKIIQTLYGHEDTVSNLILLHDNNILISADTDGTIILWDIINFFKIGQVKGHTGQINSIVYYNDILYSCSKDSNIIQWNLKEKQFSKEFKIQCDLTRNFIIQENNNFIVVGSKDDKSLVEVTDQYGNQVLQNLGDSEDVFSLQLSKDGNTLYTGSMDSTIRIWDINNLKEIGILKGHDNIIISLCLSSDNKTLYSASYDTTIKIWDVSQQKQINQIQHYSKEDIECMILSNNEQFLVVGGYDQNISIYDTKDYKLKTILKGHTDGIKALVLSADDKVLYSGGVDKYIKIWNIQQKYEINQLEGHYNDITCLLLSKDGNTLYSGGLDKYIIIWNIHLRVQIAILQGSYQSIEKMKLSFDQKTLYSISSFGIVQIWDLQSIPVIYDRIFYENVFRNKLDEQKMLLYLQYFNKFQQHMLFTKKYFNPLYICIENQFVECLKYMLKNNLIFWIYNSKVQSPLIVAIKSRNKDIIKKIFKYILQDENSRYLTKQDMIYLFQCEYPEVDRFLAFLPQNISNYHGNVQYVSNLTQLKRVNTKYSQHIEFHQYNLNQLVQKNQTHDNKQYEQNKENKLQLIQNDKIEDKEKLNIQKQVSQVQKNLHKNENDNKNLKNTKFVKLCINLEFKEMSEISLLFLQKYKKSQNAQFVTSPFQYLIQYKWIKVRWYYMLLAVLYWIFLVLFTIFLFDPHIVFLIINFLLLLQQVTYEILLYVIDGKNYILDQNNWFNILTIIHSSYTLLFVYFQSSFNPTFLAYLKLFSIVFVYFRGLLFMKVFNALRHLINMIIGVTNSIYSTLLIFVYGVLAVAVLMSHSVISFTFQNSLKNAFSSIFGNFPEEEEDIPFDQTLWIVIVFQGILITTVLANFLIAIMSSKYTELELQQVVISLREQADIILQIEKLKKIFTKSKQQNNIGQNGANVQSYLMMAVPLEEHIRDQSIKKIIKKLNKKKKQQELLENSKKLPNIHNKVLKLYELFEQQQIQNQKQIKTQNEKINSIDQKLNQLILILKINKDVKQIDQFQLFYEIAIQYKYIFQFILQLYTQQIQFCFQQCKAKDLFIIDIHLQI